MGHIFATSSEYLNFITFLCPANSYRVFLKGSKHNFVDKIAIWCSQGVLLPIINLAKPGGRESEFSKSWLWSWPVKLFTASWMKNGQSSDGKALLAFLHTISHTMGWIPFKRNILYEQLNYEICVLRGRPQTTFTKFVFFLTTYPKLYTPSTLYIYLTLYSGTHNWMCVQ